MIKIHIKQKLLAKILLAHTSNSLIYPQNNNNSFFFLPPYRKRKNIHPC